MALVMGTTVPMSAFAATETQTAAVQETATAQSTDTASTEATAQDGAQATDTATDSQNTTAQTGNTAVAGDNTSSSASDSANTNGSASVADKTTADTSETTNATDTATQDAATTTDATAQDAASTDTEVTYQADPNEGVQYAEGRVIVVMKNQTSTDEAQAAVSTADATVTETIDEDLDGQTAVVAQTADNRSVAQTVEELSSNPNIDIVQPDYIVCSEEDLAAEDSTDDTTDELSAQSTDEGLTADALTNDSQVGTQYHLSQMNISSAWSLAKCNNKVGVAVFDTGVQTNHPDLSANIKATCDISTYSTSTGSYSGVSGDDMGHGTHVCGIISARTGNSTGVSGVSYNANLVVADVFQNGYAYTSDLVKAYKWLMSGISDTYNVHVVNMSVGGAGTTSSNGALEKQIDAAAAKGIVTVCSAGNDGSSASEYPGDYSSCISVMNLQSNDTLASSSNYGSAKDICAYGTHIYSTTVGSSYGYKSGTSMAAPVVSGVVALMYAANPYLSAEQARSIITSTATKLSGANTGNGKVNATAAVKAAAGVTGSLYNSTDLADASISKIGSYQYNGSAITPNVTVKINGETLTKDTDYTVSYANNTSAGTATATITGTGDYTGSQSTNFTITTRDISTATMSLANTSYSYTGNANTPKVTVVCNGATLSASEYSVAYANNTDPGTATVTITGKNDFKGTKSTTFTINGQTSDSWTRLAGTDRYNTMSKVVDVGFSDNADCHDTAILVRGDDFPDALSASSLAGTIGCPVITTTSSSLDANAAAELERLNVHTVYILGSNKGITDGVEATVSALNGGIEVHRVYGQNRVDTSVAVAQTAQSLGASSGTCIIAKGWSYADALSISPYAYASGSPIFLANSDGTISDSVKQAIEDGGYDNVIVLGSDSGISDESVEALGHTWIRLAGSDRYATSKAICEWEVGNTPDAAIQPSVTMHYSGMAVARGDDFPDALAASSMLGKTGSVIVLVPSNVTTANGSATKSILQSTAGSSSDCTGYILGGTGSVNSLTETWLSQISAGTLN